MSTQSRLVGAAAALALAAAAAACESSAASDGAEAPRSPRAGAYGTGGPSATAQPAGHRFEVTNARRARPGRDYESVATIPGHRRDGSINFFPAVAPDGELVGVIMDTDTGGDGLPQQRLVLKDPVTGSERLIPDPGAGGGPERQMQGAVASRRWVVWLETASTSMAVSDWTLYSFDRRSGAVHRLAAAEHRPGRHSLRPPDDSRPSIGANGRVYLAAVRIHQGHPQTVVESVPVDGSGRMRVEVRDAVFPTASGNFLTWAAGGRQKGLVVYRRKLSGGPVHKILDLQGGKCARGRGLGAAGGVVAWIVHCSGSDHLQVWRRGHVVADIADPSSNAGYLRVTRRYVAEGSGSGPYRQYVYDVAAGKLLKVGHGNLSGDMPGHGAHLTWVSYSGPHGRGETHVVRLTGAVARR